MRGRTVDKVYAKRHESPDLLVADIRAGLANGSMVRGETQRTASGRGMTPVQGDILLAHQVSGVEPPLGRGQTAVAWEVSERPEVTEAGWRAVVVGIRTKSVE
jgi:hypothetical protein